MIKGLGTVLVVLAAVVAVFCGVWFGGAWLLMIGVGIAHRDWWPLMPTLGFRGALPLSFVFGGFAGGLTAVTFVFGRKSS